jgi:hypothetical protein
MDTFFNYLSILWNEKWRNNYIQVSGFLDAQFKNWGDPGFTTLMPNKQYIHYFCNMDTFVNYLSILWNKK